MGFRQGGSIESLQALSAPVRGTFNRPKRSTMAMRCCWIINLMWRPSVKLWIHLRSLADLPRAAVMDVDIQIGIDACVDNMDKGLKVFVRALDFSKRAWVSGFGLRYDGGDGGTQGSARNAGPFGACKNDPQLRFDKHMKDLKEKKK